MQIFGIRFPHSLAHPLVLSLIFGVLTNACKPSDKPSTSSEDQASNTQPSLAQRQAEEVIANDPNVELVNVQGDKLYIQNKYTKRSLVLPFQIIIDGHYQMIQEDKAMAERILKVQQANKKAQLDQAPPETKDWGKTPTWIPRYPGLDLSPSKIHTPRKDGSIWGSISGTHSDTIERIKDTLISEFKKSSLELTSNMAKKNSVIMIFDNNQIAEDDSQEKRKVTCSITKRGEKTRLSIQYSYGM